MTEKQFDAIAYFKQLTEENNTCRLYNFVATTCSGPDTVQGVLQQFRTASNFIMVSDTVDSNTHSLGEGFFDRNVYTVWILASYKRDDMADREEKLNICRYIIGYLKIEQGDAQAALDFNREALEYDDSDPVFLDNMGQTYYRLLHDKEYQKFGDQLEYLNLNQVYSTELGRYSMNGCTGLYFMLTSDEPTDLQYDESLWKKQ